MVFRSTNLYHATIAELKNHCKLVEHLCRKIKLSHGLPDSPTKGTCLRTIAELESLLSNQYSLHCW
uniref:Uncharacterized protein n=1 Tax=Arundo donax TaxID=35708 RepID=A0A0A9FXR5_ARUDO